MLKRWRVESPGPVNPGAKKTIHVGRIGWSNTRSGAEFYARMPDNSNGRWANTTARQQEVKGALLIDQMDPGMRMEGRHVLVVTFSPLDKDAVIDDYAAQVAELVGITEKQEPRLSGWSAARILVELSLVLGLLYMIGRAITPA
jgi:hypothetical protein